MLIESKKSKKKSQKMTKSFLQTHAGNVAFITIIKTHNKILQF